MKPLKTFLYVALATALASCGQGQKSSSSVPVIGFVEAFPDQTIEQARIGFTDALKAKGYSEDQHTVKIEYGNAQGSQVTLTQIINNYISKPVDLLATSTTVSSLAAVQRTKTIPICEMVSPTPERMKVLDANGKAPANLFGVIEDLPYIDTSFSLIPKLLKPTMGKLKVGMIYNQAEPQSVDAMQRIKDQSDKLGITLIAVPLNSSADAKLVTQSLLDKNIDAFFANPDNVVFSAFETIKQSCDAKFVPIFTSEAGLVKRGAVAAFGADIYQWGYQAGLQAAQYLKTRKMDGLQPEMVKVRKRVYNKAAAAKYHITVPTNFQAI